MEAVWNIPLHKRALQPQTSSPYQKRTALHEGGRCTSDQPDIRVETGVDITILGKRCDANSLSEELAFRSSRSVAMREGWIAKENRAGLVTGTAGGKAEMSRSRSRRVLLAARLMIVAMIRRPLGERGCAHAFGRKLEACNRAYAIRCCH
jgi:hypothetical protein